MLAQLQLDAQALGCPTSLIEFCKSVDLPDQHFLAYGAGAGLVGIATCQVSAMEASVLHHEIVLSGEVQRRQGAHIPIVCQLHTC